MNHFRGIAIIFIVVGHCFAVADFSYHSIIGKTILNLTTGGTTLFVFISGFLFHHVYYKKFQLRGFIVKKINYVLIPYLVFSSIAIAYPLFRIYGASINPFSAFIPEGQGLFFNYAGPILEHYLTGGAATAYWYIPFIMIVFVMSPIFLQFIKLRLRTQVFIAILFLICSALIHRGTYQNGFSVFQNVLFFTPVYLFGIISSERKSFIYARFKGREFYILSLLIALAIIQTYIGKSGNYFKDPFIYGGIDLMIIQKILLCFFFMIWLNRFENYKLSSLKLIAENSFGIFFSHGIILLVIKQVKGKLDFSFPANSFMTYILVAVVVFLLSIILTLLVKKTLPKNRRYLIGS